MRLGLSDDVRETLLCNVLRPNLMTGSSKAEKRWTFSLLISSRQWLPCWQAHTARPSKYVFSLTAQMRISPQR